MFPVALVWTSTLVDNPRPGLVNFSVKCLRFSDARQDGRNNTPGPSVFLMEGLTHIL